MSEPLTPVQAARSIRALARAEKHYESLGYDPEEAVQLIYNRALRYYENVFPEDEVGFRDILLRRYERQLVRARATKRKEARNAGDFSEQPRRDSDGSEDPAAAQALDPELLG